ncbi:MAG: alpha/beta fold hydrolase [Gammaproteobacteria bacterium]|nr:alpha/beta fold hydrolase [Gammaproteobacteria bacterium]
MLAILDAIGVGRAAFICQLMGGWTGSQVALRHRDRMTALVMSHTPGVFTNERAINDPEKVRDPASQPRGAFGNAALAHDFPERDPAGAVLYNQISAFNGIDPSAVPRQIGRAGLNVDTATLEDWNVPTLFVSADKDILFPADYIEALASTLPGARFVNLGDAGHSSYFERPAAFNDAVAGFLAEAP